MMVLSFYPTNFGA